MLARAGQFPAAHTLPDEAAALVSPTCWAPLQAGILMAKAELNRLAGAPERAETSLRGALRISQDRHAAPLADQAAAALAGLTGHPQRQAGVTGSSGKGPGWQGAPYGPFRLAPLPGL
jgi:hypothetical protein